MERRNWKERLRGWGPGVVSLIAVPLLVACDVVVGPCPDTAAPEPISLLPKDTAVTVGDTVDFDVVEDYADREVTFVVFVDSIAEIDSLGRATTTAAGTTQVAVEASSVPSECAVGPNPSFLMVTP